MSDKQLWYDKGSVSGILAAGDTTLVTITTKFASHLGFQFSVTGQALDNFDLFIRSHAEAPWQDITPTNWASLASGDYNTLHYSSGNLAAQAAGSSGMFELGMVGIESVQIKVSAAVDGAAISYWYSMTSMGSD